MVDRFYLNQMSQAKESYDSQGYVVFDQIFSDDEIRRLQKAYDQVMASHGSGGIDPRKMNDAIYQHPDLENMARDERILNLAYTLIGHPVELQHAKFVYKPKGEPQEKRGYWHQDFPFFPHTNYDLCAIGIHLDREDEHSGALQVIPESHKWGERSHQQEGRFAYRCVEEAELAKAAYKFLIGPAGFVSCHHGLTMHGTEPKQNVSESRRLLVLQFRAQDAIQLAGVVWRCSGDLAYPQQVSKRARFNDGSIIALRDDAGRLIDLSGKFKPDAV